MEGIYAFLNSKAHPILNNVVDFFVEFASEERVVLGIHTINDDTYQILFTKAGIEYRKKPSGGSITELWYSQIK